jgi:hypothetical protein
MKETEKSATEKDKKLTQGIVVMENIPGVTSQFNKIARKHGFRVANKTENRVKDIMSSAKTPLGDKNMNIVYNIPCNCQKYDIQERQIENGAQERRSIRTKFDLKKRTSAWGK